MAAGAAVATYFGASGAAAAIVAGAVNGALIGAAVGAVTAAVNGGDILEGMGKGALTGAATGAIAGGVSYAFSNAGAAATPQGGTDVTQTGAQIQAGQVAEAPSLAGPAVPEGGVTVGGEGVIQTPPATDNQYLLTTQKMNQESLAMQQQMGKEAFYREAASGAIQAGVGAYAEKEAAKEEADVRRQEMIEARGAGVLAREQAAPTVRPEFAAERPRVAAPAPLRPVATRVGVARPTANIRDITVQQGVLPNA